MSLFVLPRTIKSSISTTVRGVLAPALQHPLAPAPHPESCPLSISSSLEVIECRRLCTVLLCPAAAGASWIKLVTDEAPRVLVSVSGEETSLDRVKYFSCRFLNRWCKIRQPTVTMKHMTRRNTAIAAWAFPYWKLGLRFSVGVMFLLSRKNRSDTNIVGRPQAAAIWNGGEACF